MRNKVNKHLSEASAPSQVVKPIWARPQRTRRERPVLDREQIVRVALTLADAEGIEAISLRRIATLLGVSAMALYWYVECKEDVLDLMIDAVYGELSFPQPAPADWRSHLQAIAVQTRAMMLRHPWLVSLIGHRAVLGPNALKQTEYLLEVIGQLGVDMTTSMSILATFNAYVAGFVLREMGEVEAQRRTGLSKEEWQQHMAPYVQEQVVESGRYPTLARYLSASEERSPDEQFIFGLTCLLEGIAASTAAFHH